MSIARAPSRHDIDTEALKLAHPIEDVVARLNAAYGGHGTLPWRSATTDRPFGR